MKKIITFTASFLATLLPITTFSYPNYYDPRVTVWGFAGAPEDVRGDLLFPLLSNLNQLFYLDLQGNYTYPGSYSGRNDRSDAGYASAGVGFRRLYSNANTNAIFGAYFFYDHDISVNHNTFHVLSPGIEGLFCNWDARVNGYFPVNQRKRLKSFSSQFPCDCADCVNCANCLQAVFFQGHSQFGHHFSLFEQAGRGGDAEVGYTFRRLNYTQIHGGVYYFNFNTPGHSENFHDNPNNLTGVEGRLETPLNSHLALTVEASYDRYQKGAVLGGLRFTPTPATKYPYDLRGRMVDPIPRNLGTLQTGSGVPTIRIKHDDGIVLQRSNIYFFSATGGSAFADPSSSGTFENPLRADQFTQSVVNQIGNSANYYFPTGSYVISGTGVAPNASLTLLPGDSIYGRTSNYVLAATGAARPILLGSLTLPGYNTLASTQVINSGVSSGATSSSITALNIIGAPSVFMCNDNIVATSTVTGDLDPGIVNSATGIFAQNSQVTIQNSTISANAIVTGTIADPTEASPFGGVNLAVGIGANAVATTAEGAVQASDDFTGNTFIISNSSISANVSSATNNWDSLATGIGVNADNNGTGSFTKNTFLLSNSNINSTAATNTNNSIGSLNSAIGIGANESIGTAEFSGNKVTLLNTPIISKAVVALANFGGVNISFGIGSSGTTDSNTFILNKSNISSSAAVGGVNSGADNTSIGIGSGQGVDFSFNTFTVTDSNINAISSVQGNNVTETGAVSSANVAVGIGSWLDNTFVSNIFTLTNSPVTAGANVGGANLGLGSLNAATGIGVVESSSFDNNEFTLSNSSVTANANVGSNNGIGGISTATGIGDVAGSTSFTGNSFTLMNGSAVSGNATVGGDNNGTNLATGIGVNLGATGFTGNIFNLNNNPVTANATVIGSNGNSNEGAVNSAVGIGNNQDVPGAFGTNTIAGDTNVTASVTVEGPIVHGINQAQNENLNLLPPHFISKELAEVIGVNNTTDQAYIFKSTPQEMSDSTSVANSDSSQQQNEALEVQFHDIMLKQPAAAFV